MKFLYSFFSVSFVARVLGAFYFGLFIAFWIDAIRKAGIVNGLFSGGFTVTSILVFYVIGFAAGRKEK